MSTDDSDRRPRVAPSHDGGIRNVGLLNQRLRLATPEDGLGVTSDAVFLASAIPAEPGMRFLDAGCGVGVVGLCLAARVPGLDIHGIEIDPHLAELARSNAAGNGIGGWSVHTGDLFGPLPTAYRSGFDCVGTNPPWQRADASTPSPDPRRTLARREGGSGRKLGDWLAVCAGLLRENGVLVTIVPPNRIDDSLVQLGSWAAEMQPLQARAGRSPRTVLVRLRRSAAPSRRWLPPLPVHAGGHHSLAAERILRAGEPFPWPSPADLQKGAGLVHIPV